MIFHILIEIVRALDLSQEQSFLTMGHCPVFLSRIKYGTVRNRFNTGVVRGCCYKINVKVVLRIFLTKVSR